MQSEIGVALLLISAFLSVLISIYFLIYGKRSKLLYSFLFCQVLVFIWSVGYIAEGIFKAIQLKWITLCFEGIALCFIGSAWLIFSMIYTRNNLINKKEILYLILLIPGIIYIFMLTNPYHGLYYKSFELYRREYGIIFWINVFFTYAYVFISTFIIIKYSLNMLGNEKKQSILIMIAAAAPFIASILYVSRIFKVKFDITPISFSVSLLLFAIATFKYRFLNAVPAGLRKVFNTVEASIALIDNTGVIVSRNNSFIETFGEYKGNNVNEFYAYLRKSMIEDIDDVNLICAILKGGFKNVLGEIRLDIPENTIFRVAVQSVLDNINFEIGRVISFTDITSYRKLSDELAKKNAQLIEVNEKLRQHMMVVEELAMQKERNRMAREIHDSLGHTLTFLAKIQEGAILDFGQDNNKMLESIKMANKITRQGLKELRMSLYNMMPERQGMGAFFEELERLSSDFKSSGVKVEITNTCRDEYINPEISQSLLRICQEAVTNSIRHGLADEINIIIRIDEKRLKLFIIDNGKGCTQIKKGYGLSGMEERVKKHGGNILLGSDGESGFNIRIEIPIEEGLV